MTSRQRQLCIQYDATEMMWQEQTTVILIINLFMGNVEHIKTSAFGNKFTPDEEVSIQF
jgi:hypothetical protein